MEWQAVSNGYALRGARYDVRLILEKVPFFQFVLDGVSFGELPAVSCFDQAGQKEKLSQIELKQMDLHGDRLIVIFQATSNLWQSHRFIWTFEKKGAEYSHIIRGNGALGRCFFFSSGIPGEYDDGESGGSETNARLNVEHYFNPAVNLGNVEEYTISQFSRTGLSGEFQIPGNIFLPERACSLFAPSPLL